LPKTSSKDESLAGMIFMPNAGGHHKG